MYAYHGWPFLTSPEHPDLSAVGTVLIHGCVGLLAVLPIVLRTRMRATAAVLAFIGGPALDFDHVVAARSFRTQALESLGHRPFIHSLLFAAVLALLVLVLTRRQLIAWAVFAVVASHLLFDAAGGGEYWLYPLRHPDSMPWLAFPIGLAVLLGISARLTRPGISSPPAHPINEHALQESSAHLL
jgi:membrane-bound metal-dependent hydrolase YbcI (DUF457 family)